MNNDIYQATGEEEHFYPCVKTVGIIILGCDFSENGHCKHNGQKCSAKSYTEVVKTIDVTDKNN